MPISAKGRDAQTGRLLALHTVADVNELDEQIAGGSRWFIAMLVWDAADASVESIAGLARKLIDSGCAYLCCWGNGCERVHDLFDGEWVDQWTQNGFDPDSAATIMTTWHTEDSLDEFIYFCLLHTTPTSKYQPQCNSVVAIVINRETAADRISEVFRDPAGFYSSHEGSEN